MEPASQLATHMEELPQLAKGLQHLTVALWPHPNPQPTEEPVHTTMQTNITMTLLQDIPTFDGQGSSMLEEWFMDIKTAADILTRSHTCLAGQNMLPNPHSHLQGPSSRQNLRP